MPVISGLFAAPITPLNAQGCPSLDVFERTLDFLLDRGVEGICVGGATTEYPHFELDERKSLIRTAAQRTHGRAMFVVAVGSSSLRGVLSLSRYAADAGAQALLLPAPHFFPYDQLDIEAFCVEVSRTLSTPLLLYNLPGFTTGFKLETVIGLLQNETTIVGIKDSGGDREWIRALTEARGHREFALMIGNDHLILESLEAGWNGAISGSINACPELYVSLFRSFRGGDRESARKCQAAIELIGDRLGAIPFPWGIRAALEVRGIPVGPPPLPLAPARRKQIEDLKRWFSGWLSDVLPPILQGAR